MKLFNTTLVLFLAAISVSSVFANTDSTFDQQLLDLQHEWAKVNYSLKDDAQEKAFEALILEAEQFMHANPKRAEALVWHGIIESSYAGAKGGMGALAHAKLAKASFEKAMEIDESILEGSVYTSLGILYHKVPGWPISFGDDKYARVLLEKAVSVNPTGIDPNYFYAEYLFDEREYEKAKHYLELALNAPLREERPLADQSRRAEVQSLLAKVESKIKKKKT